MSMDIEFYINMSSGPPWYIFLVVIFIFLIIILWLGFLEKKIIDFLKCRKEIKSDKLENKEILDLKEEVQK